MTVSKVDFVAYGVKDLDASIKFYQDKLGLKLDIKLESFYAEFDVGGTAFGLYAGEPPRQTSGSVGFHVPNVAEAVAELKGKGLEAQGEIEDTPGCRMAFYLDPDGNSFILHEKPKV